MGMQVARGLAREGCRPAIGCTRPSSRSHQEKVHPTLAYLADSLANRFEYQCRRSSVTPIRVGEVGTHSALETIPMATPMATCTIHLDHGASAFLDRRGVPRIRIGNTLRGVPIFWDQTAHDMHGSPRKTAYHSACRRDSLCRGPEEKPHSDSSNVHSTTYKRFGDTGCDGRGAAALSQDSYGPKAMQFLMRAKCRDRAEYDHQPSILTTRCASAQHRRRTHAPIDYQSRNRSCSVAEDAMANGVVVWQRAMVAECDSGAEPFHALHRQRCRRRQNSCQSPD